MPPTVITAWRARNEEICESAAIFEQAGRSGGVAADESIGRIGEKAFVDEFHHARKGLFQYAGERVGEMPAMHVEAPGSTAEDVVEPRGGRVALRAIF